MTEKKNFKWTAQKGLAITLIVILICSAIAGWMGTNFGSIEVTEVTYVTDSGKTLSGHLYVPNNATPETPAPAIVTIHGYTRTSESHGVIALELARRGYVIFNIDMYGHGESENGTCGTGEELVDALWYLTGLDFVDTEKLGATGHSNGGRCIEYMTYWDDPTSAPEIQSILFAGWDPAYKNKETGEFYNKYGNIDVGMVAAEYDDFFYTNGTTNPGREFMASSAAKSFVGFGDDTKITDAEVPSGQYFYETIDGEETARVIYMNGGIHVCEVFMPAAIAGHNEFFDKTLGSPIDLDPYDQIGQIKEVLTGICYLAIPFLLIFLTLCMLDLKVFSVLKASERPVPAVVKDKKGLLWFWGTLIFVAAVSFFSYNFSTSSLLTDRYNYQVILLGIWAVFGGVACTIGMVAYYYCYGKKNGVSLVDNGVKISFKNLLLTIILALCVVFATYGLVCVVYEFFGTDFRFWFLGFKPMQTDRIFYALRWSLLYMAYYVTNSVSANCFKYNNIGGKRGNILLLGLSNAFSCIVVFIIHYGHALITGYTYWFGSNNYRVGVGWLFSTVLFLFASALVSRAIYNRTKNPYLGGIINAIIICMLGTCQTMIGYPI